MARLPAHRPAHLTLLVGQAADDVASETWIAVVRGLHGFSGDEPGFRAWLLTVARHRAIDWMRQDGRKPLPVGDDDHLTAHLPAAPDAATVAIDLLSAQEAVRLVTRLLPPLQAEAVILRSVAGLEVPEAARVMGKRPGAVRVLTHRGLRTLARELHVHDRTSRRG